MKKKMKKKSLSNFLENNITITYHTEIKIILLQVASIYFLF